MMQIDINVIRESLGAKEMEIIALRSALKAAEEKIKELEAKIGENENVVGSSKPN